MFNNILPNNSRLTELMLSEAIAKRNHIALNGSDRGVGEQGSVLENSTKRLRVDQIAGFNRDNDANPLTMGVMNPSRIEYHSLGSNGNGQILPHLPERRLASATYENPVASSLAESERRLLIENLEKYVLSRRAIHDELSRRNLQDELQALLIREQQGDGNMRSELPHHTGLSSPLSGLSHSDLSFNGTLGDGTSSLAASMAQHPNLIAPLPTNNALQLHLEIAARKRRAMLLLGLHQQQQQNARVALSGSLFSYSGSACGNPTTATTYGHESSLQANQSRNFAGATNLSVPLHDRSTSIHDKKSIGTVASSKEHVTLTCLPVSLAMPDDQVKLNRHQVLLRRHMEAFCATEEDVSTHARGRNKPIKVGQVGIRCIHCAKLPISQRRKGSVYFPSKLLGMYQAAQNMSTIHMQSGECSEMPDDVKAGFGDINATKGGNSLVGRSYWAESAAELGLIDTDDGIRMKK